MSITPPQRHLFVAGLLGASALPLLAQQTPAVAPDPTLPGAGLSVMRVLGALALVIALFLAGVWLFRNWQRLSLRRGLAPQLVVLEARPLGQRQSLYVVGYQHLRLLLAASPAGISLLTSLPPAAEPAALNGHSHSHDPARNGHGSFAEVMRRVAALERALHRHR